MNANGYVLLINEEAHENCQILNRVPHVLSECIMALSSDLSEGNMTLQGLKESILLECNINPLLRRTVIHWSILGNV